MIVQDLLIVSVCALVLNSPALADCRTYVNLLQMPRYISMDNRGMIAKYSYGRDKKRRREVPEFY